VARRASYITRTRSKPWPGSVAPSRAGSAPAARSVGPRSQIGARQPPRESLSLGVFKLKSFLASAFLVCLRDVDRSLFLHFSVHWSDWADFFCPSVCLPKYLYFLLSFSIFALSLDSRVFLSYNLSYVIMHVCVQRRSQWEGLGVKPPLALRLKQEEIKQLLLTIVFLVYFLFIISLICCDTGKSVCTLSSL